MRRSKPRVGGRPALREGRTPSLPAGLCRRTATRRQVLKGLALSSFGLAGFRAGPAAGSSAAGTLDLGTPAKLLRALVRMRGSLAEYLTRRRARLRSPYRSNGIGRSNSPQRGSSSSGYSRSMRSRNSRGSSDGELIFLPSQNPARWPMPSGIFNQAGCSKA